MNLDSLGTIAEIVAAVGVIFSLLYLAKQIRASSDTENARAFESAINSWHLATANLLDDKNRDLFMKGLGEYQSLTDSETLHFHAMSAHLIDRFEIMLQFERLGVTEQGHLTNMIGPFVKDLFNYPGFRSYWDGESPYFSRNLIQWYEENVEGKEDMAAGYIGQIFDDSAG